MIIISGHDNTMSTNHFFLQYALGKSNDFFRTPFFASQMAFEVKRSNDNKQKIPNPQSPLSSISIYSYKIILYFYLKFKNN